MARASLSPGRFHRHRRGCHGHNLDQPIDYRTSDLGALNRHFLQYLNLGGYPEALFSPEIQRDPGRFIKADIIDKVLLRDLPSLYGIQDIQEMNYWFTRLAFNTAGEVSLEERSKRSGVAKNTIRRYLEYLEAAFLIKIVHRIDRDARRFRRANLFKVYLTIPAIRSALFSPIGEDDEAFGAVVETAIFSQWFHSDQVLHYARWKEGEVDLVALDPRQRVAWAVEIEFMPASLYCFLVGYHTVLSRQLDSERARRGGRVFIRGGLPWEVPIGS